MEYSCVEWRILICIKFDHWKEKAPKLCETEI